MLCHLLHNTVTTNVTRILFALDSLSSICISLSAALIKEKLIPRNLCYHKDKSHSLKSADLFHTVLPKTFGLYKDYCLFNGLFKTLYQLHKPYRIEYQGCYV